MGVKERKERERADVRERILDVARDMFASDTRWLAHYGFSAFAMPNPATGLS